MNDIDKLQDMINNSKKIVFFSGAGVSTESGIKDFRSIDGLYNMNYKYPPEEILSHTFFINNTKEFYTFYKDKLNCLKAEPNLCHKYLKHLEDIGKDITIVTQNIDGLHSKAGCKKVYELHGTIYKNKCMKCSKEYNAENVFNCTDVPYCTCGGIIKPEVVLYEEGLDDYTVDKSIEAISQTDLLIVAGTSLTVYPASSFIRYYKGNKLVMLNRDSTKYDYMANLVIHDSLKNIFKNLK